MKVCHILSGDLWAGAEVMARNLMAVQAKTRGLEISAILLNEGRLAGEIRSLGIPLVVLPESTLSFSGVLRKTRDSLRRHAPDIIHSHRYKENLLAWLASGTGRSARLVTTLHGLSEARGSTAGMKNRIARTINDVILARRFDRVIAVSEDIGRFLLGRGFREDKVKVIHNGIAIPFVALGGPVRDEFVIGSIGRFFPVKDYPLMVEVASRISRHGAGIRFELAGDGPEKAKILDLVRRHRLEERFFLRGFVDDLDDFYRGIDLYLVTSRHEGIPMSVLEAMGHGLPVVAPRVGGLQEILADGLQAGLVDGRDPDAFATICLRLFRDSALRGTMAASARKRVEDAFGAERMAEKYHRLYLEVA